MFKSAVSRGAAVKNIMMLVVTLESGLVHYVMRLAAAKPGAR